MRFVGRLAPPFVERAESFGRRAGLPLRGPAAAAGAGADRRRDEEERDGKEEKTERGGAL